MTRRYAFLCVALSMTMVTAPMAGQDDVQVERVLLTVGGGGDQTDCDLEYRTDMEFAKLRLWACEADSANIISRSSCGFQWYGSWLAAQFKVAACHQRQLDWLGRQR